MHKWKLLSLILLFSILVSIGGRWSTLAGNSDTNPLKKGVALAAPSVDMNTYLPIVSNNYPAVQTIFGVELYNITEGRGLNEIAAAGATYIRHNYSNSGPVDGLIWTAVEPNKGDRNWGVLSEMENQLINAAERDMEVILIVRSTPLWARLDPNSPCGPIKPSEYAAFGQFMHDAVKRYSAPPYNVKYWEIYNEPDAPINTNEPPYGMIYGCWGIGGDTYFGGEAYGEMLKVVYPYIKSANSSAQVLVGGLLLDCDPRTVCTTGPGSIPPKFLNGILLAGAGNSFDGVSFHAYDYYNAGMGKYHNPNWSTNWNTTGPVITAKADYISELMTNYGVTDKYLMNTESAILWSPDDDFGGVYPDVNDPKNTKSSYLVQSYVTALSVQKKYNLRANIWFSVFGWRNSGLLNPDLSPKLAYKAYSFAYKKLATSNFVEERTDYGSNVKEYVFQNEGKILWVVWSLNGANQTVTLPQTPSAIWDMYGNPQTITGTSFTVTLLPHYIEY
ncbi:MAG: hypothetical protein WBF05_13970 [Anaerolineales bacterium]